MSFLPAVSKGQAVIKAGKLRCAAPRPAREGETEPSICNKLIAFTNRRRQIAGSFQCERCKQDIEVRMVFSQSEPKQFSQGGNARKRKNEAPLEARRSPHQIPKCEVSQ